VPGSDLAHADSPYPVLPLPADTPPVLPEGTGGIAVHTRCPPRARRFTLAPIVGVDGKPAVYGWGDALVVVPAGERLVEVQYVEPMRSRLVTVASGQIVAVEYVAAGDGASPGTLDQLDHSDRPDRSDRPGRRPRRRQRGGGYHPLPYVAVILAMLVVFDTAAYLLTHPAGLGLGAAGLVAAVVTLGGGVPALLAVHRHQQGPVRRRGPAGRRGRPRGDR
jgi:hypothetical protein